TLIRFTRANGDDLHPLWPRQRKRRRPECCDAGRREQQTKASSDYRTTACAPPESQEDQEVAAVSSRKSTQVREQRYRAVSGRIEKPPPHARTNRCPCRGV